MAVVSFKCPNCDGELVFHPRTQKYKCEYCASAFSQEELDQLLPGQGRQIQPNSGPQEGHAAGRQENTPVSERQAEEGNIYQCPSCGAQIVTDDTTAASFCYYCHNPVVLSGRVSGEYLPHKIIPFAIDKKQATEKFLDYVHSKKFVPKAFFNKSQIDKISGVYFPYWMVDMDMEGSMRAEGRNVRVWRSGDTEYTETKIYHVERAGELHLEDITKNALKKANSKLSSGVLPYDMAKAKEFHMGFLSGFLAEKRDMEQDRFVAALEEEIRQFAESSIREGLSRYDSVQIRSKDMRIGNPKWNYALMPVWTLTYRDKRTDKVYYFACNGQTGKVCGELPVDSGRLARLFLSVFAPLFAVLLVVGYFL